MTNITARKGLAFGALIALGSSLLAGAPAHAAAGVSLAPTAGTSYAVPAGYGFALTASASSEIPTDRIDDFRFKVVNVDGKDAIAYSHDSGPDNNGNWGPYLASVDLSGDAGTSTTVDGYDYTPNGAVTNGSNVPTLWIESKDSASTSHYAVTAWLDSNFNGKIDTGEYSATQTVTFLKAADITATTSVATPIYEDDSRASATVKFTNINNEQFDGGAFNDPYVEISFKANTNDIVLGDPIFDADASDWDATNVSIGARSKGDVVSAQGWIEFYDYAATSAPYWNLVKVGGSSSTTVVAHTVDHIDISVPATTNSKTNGDVAKNSTYKVVLTANDVVSGQDVPVANAKLSVYVSVDLDNNLSSADGRTLTINGKSYSANNTLPGYDGLGTAVAPLSLTTDANGQVVLTVSSTELVNNDWVYFYADTEGGSIYSNGDFDGAFRTVQRDLSYSAYITNSDYRAFDARPGASATVEATVVDQFGALLPDGYNAVATITNYGDRSVTDAWAGNAWNDITFAPVKGGKTSLTIADAGEGTGYEVFYFNVRKTDVNGGYADQAPVTGDLYFSVVYHDAAETTVASIESPGDYGRWAFNDANGLTEATQFGSSDDPTSVTYKDFGSYDSRKVLGTQPDVLAYPASGWNGVYLGFLVKSPASATQVAGPVVNTKVTFSGSGLQFQLANDGDYGLYATDTLSTTTDGNGFAGVIIWSHKSGANTVTVTAGSKSQTITFYVDSPSADKAANIAITGPAFSLPAKNIEATALVTDEYGNAVPGAYAALLASGVGQSGTTVQFNGDGDPYSFTDDNGKLTLSVNPGLNDLGTINWTAVLDGNGDWLTASDSDVVKKATTVVALGAPVPADAKVSVASAATSQSGRAVDVTVTVTTAAGVAIPGAIVNLAATGAGYLGATTATTDANGKVTVKLIGGDSEIGDAVVTATAGSVSASAKTAFGVTDANINLAGKRVTVDWSFAAGKRVVIYRNGIQIRNFVAGSDASDSFSFNLKKGTRKIAVKVGGVTIDSQTYVIK